VPRPAHETGRDDEHRVQRAPPHQQSARRPRLKRERGYECAR
jgi:hypothetical protein